MIREWTPEAWEAYCTANPARRRKSERYRDLVSTLTSSHRGGRVLEAGCGYGRITPVLLAGTDTLIVLDRQFEMVQAVRRAVPQVLGGIVADLTQPPILDDAFDLVGCVGVLMHVRQPLAVLTQLAKSVRHGGRFVISWNNGASPWAGMMKLWAARPHALPQQFLSIEDVVTPLAKLGYVLSAINADSLLPLGACLPGTARALWPHWILRGMERCEQTPRGHWWLTRYGYEVYAAFQRAGSVPW